MTGIHRATNDQWDDIQRYGRGHSPDSCLLELRDRLTAAEQRISELEAAENYRQQDEDAERAMEPAPAGELDVLTQALVKAEAALAGIGDAEREPGNDLAWCEQRAAQVLPVVRAALEGTSYCALAEASNIEHTQLALQGHLIADLRREVDELRIEQCDQAESQRFCIDAIVQRLDKLEAAGRPDKINRLIVQDAATEGDSLVERVGAAISQPGAPYPFWHHDARAAIRAVAAWLRTETDLTHGPRAAEWLEQEVQRHG